MLVLGEEGDLDRAVVRRVCPVDLVKAVGHGARLTRVGEARNAGKKEMR